MCVAVFLPFPWHHLRSRCPRIPSFINLFLSEELSLVLLSSKSLFFFIWECFQFSLKLLCSGLLWLVTHEKSCRLNSSHVSSISFLSGCFQDFFFTFSFPNFNCIWCVLVQIFLGSSCFNSLFLEFVDLYLWPHLWSF